MMDFFQFYEKKMNQYGYKADITQKEAAKQLQKIQESWKKSSGTISALYYSYPHSGIYIYGGVGRGKSFLMNCFYEFSLIQKKSNIHLHEFIYKIHQNLRDIQGKSNPLEKIGNDLAKQYLLICFDEFYINDVADALMLYKLIDTLLNKKVFFVITSNYHPDELYPDGLYRDRIYSMISLLKKRFKILNVDIGTDYRFKKINKDTQRKTYYISRENDINTINHNFNQAAADYKENTPPILRLKEHEIPAIRIAGSVIWFNFKILCGRPYSQNNYLEIAKLFHTVFLSDVPCMSSDMDTEARRFTLLIDVLYHYKTKLVLISDVHFLKLYTKGPMEREFHRTVSRIFEMQSIEYIQSFMSRK